MGEKKRCHPLPGIRPSPGAKVRIVQIEAKRGAVTVETAGDGHNVLVFQDKGDGASSITCQFVIEK